MARFVPFEEGDEEVLARHGIEPGGSYMPVPSCAECRWWGEDGDGREIGNRSTGGARQCWRATLPDSSAYTEEELMTFPGHGCIQWEAKSDE